MTAIGVGLVWVAYTAGLLAYCWLKGYDINVGQLLTPVAGQWPPAGK